MDTFVENTGVVEQEKQITVPTENEKQIQIPIENVEMAGAPLANENTADWNSEGDEPADDVRIVRAEEKPDPLGRNIINSPLNEMKAGYDYAFRKDKAKR